VTPAQAAVESAQLEVRVLRDAVLVLVGAYLLSRLTSAALSAFAERSPTRRITIKMFVPVTSFLIYGVAIYVVVDSVLQLTTAQLLAVSGLIGAGIGFGLKDLVGSAIGGFVIVLENTYQVGDKVEIGEHYGEVSEIGLRATTLITPDDTAVKVPNTTLFTDSIADANDGAPEMMVVVEVAVAPDADLQRATSVVEDALVTSRYVYVDDDHPFVVLVEDDAYYRTIRGKAYVADLRDEFAFASDVTERALVAFDEYGIETPTVPLDSLDDRE